MMDALVSLLNKRGYQPAWLAQTGLVPPDVYNVARTANGRRLVRRGPLRDYLPAVAALPIVRGRAESIQHHETSKKKITSAAGFLNRALSSLGVGAVAKLDLGFTGSSDLSISFSEVEYARVEVSAIEPLLPQMQLHAIPDEVVGEGRLHIAYEYLYAKQVLIARADQKSFDSDVTARLPDVIDICNQVHVEVERNTRLVFTAKSQPAAFAYLAARLTRNNDRWLIDMSAERRDGQPSGIPYLPAAHGVVLEADDAPR